MDHSIPTAHDAKYYSHPLTSMYYCPGCSQLKCLDCIQDETRIYYCPNCLFEVTTANVKSEHGT